eukprot:4094494-Ditylum_brightwellii.AAC.1
MEKRTWKTMEEDLEQYILMYRESKAKGNKNTPANHMGVNSDGLINIDPERIIIPILHCPMGLVDK